jgi:DNA-binding IclR family transcriptional regulator
MAVPVHQDDRSVVAALNMAAHTSMLSLEEMLGQLSPHLLATADRISARLGFRRDDEAKR